MSDQPPSSVENSSSDADFARNEAQKEVIHKNAPLLFAQNAELAKAAGESPEAVFNHLVAHGNGILMTRQEMFRRLFDPRRDIEAECGHTPLSYPINPETYRRLWERDGIARKVVTAMARACWQVSPTIFEDDNPRDQTPFEKAWASLPRQLHGGTNFFADEDASPIWEVLRRADELSGIGSYGVIIIGLDGPDDLSKPAPMRVIEFDEMTQTSVVKKDVKSRKLKVLRCLPDYLALIDEIDNDLSSPRYGQPTHYQVGLADPAEPRPQVSDAGRTIMVHWSRVVHIAEGILSNETYADPRMRPVEDRILDIRKLLGGSAEMYWKGAFPGISFESHPGGDDAAIDRMATKDMVENYMNGLQRYLALVGMSAKSLAPQVVDPTPQIKCQIDAICVALDMPVRIFMGSERGQLASAQDDDEWNDHVRGRNRNYTSPRLIAPFINRLILLGVLPVPKQFSISWPDLTSQTTKEKSQVAFQRTQALVQYCNSHAPLFMTPLDYLSRILGITEEEAVAVLDNALKERSDLLKLIQELAPKKTPPAGDTTQQNANATTGAAATKAGVQQGDVASRAARFSANGEDT